METAVAGDARLRAAKALSVVDGIVAGLPDPDGWREVLGVQVAVGRAKLETHPAIHLPWLSARCVGAPDDMATRIAAVCALVYLGADVLDNVADDELPDEWAQHGPGVATLAGATFLSCLTTRAIAELKDVGVPAGRCWEIAHELSTGMLEMGAGQYRDIAGGAATSLDEVRAIVEAKSGGEMALFARLGAMTATDEVGTITSLSEMGSAYGSAAQVISDAHDLWRGPGNDLKNRKMTLPIAHALETLEEPDARLLRSLLAWESPVEVRPAILGLLRRAGSLRYVAFVAELYRHRALRLLGEALPPGDLRDELESLLGSASLIGRRTLVAV